MRVQEESGFSKYFSKTQTQEPLEFNRVDIRIIKKDLGKETELAQGTGNWTRFVQFDGKIYWQQNQPLPQLIPESMETALPSSSLRRPELALIAEKRFSEADKFNKQNRRKSRAD